MKRFLLIVVLLAMGGAVGWYVARSGMNHRMTPAAEKKSSERKVLYYQSAMHPWIKSDKPGRCTICGMELTPVYEGQQGFEADSDVVSLNQTMIQVLRVQTVEAKKQKLQKSLRVAGTMDDNETKHRVLSAYTDGRIDRLHVNHVGAEVKEGQPLAEFYSPTLLEAEREYVALVKKLAPASTPELKASQQQLITAAGSRLRQFGLTEEQIKALPEKPKNDLNTEIVAPAGGTVVLKNVYEGQYVMAGDKLFEIADFSIMWFMFRAYEQDMPWIRIGQKVDVTTASHPGQDYTGTIAFIDPNFDQTTRSTTVRVEIPNRPPGDPHRLLHRLYADGIVHIEMPEVLAVPRSAVIQTGPEAVVYVDQGGGAYKRTVVKLGRRGDNLVEIVTGLSEGDKVVTNGNLLIDGQAEMNRSFASTPEPPTGGTMSTNSMPLTDAQKEAMAAFVKVSDAISAALAKDDVAQFNQAAPDAAAATDSLVATLKDRKDLADMVEHLTVSRQFGGAADLAAARKAFHPFANAGASILATLRKETNAPPLEIFECPMVDQAVPGVPKKGRWVQAAGRDIGNPYFGEEMLDCGVQVKP